MTSARITSTSPLLDEDDDDDDEEEEEEEEGCTSGAVLINMVICALPLTRKWTRRRGDGAKRKGRGGGKEEGESKRVTNK